MILINTIKFKKLIDDFHMPHKLAADLLNLSFRYVGNLIHGLRNVSEDKIFLLKKNYSALIDEYIYIIDSLDQQEIEKYGLKIIFDITKKLGTRVFISINPYIKIHNLYTARRSYLNKTFITKSEKKTLQEIKKTLRSIKEILKKC